MEGGKDMHDLVKGFWSDESGAISTEVVLLGFAFLSFLSFIEVLGANALHLFDPLLADAPFQFQAIRRKVVRPAPSGATTATLPHSPIGHHVRRGRHPDTRRSSANLLGT